MKTKVAVILLLAIFAMSSITMITIRPVSAGSGAKTLMLSDAELMAAFDNEHWGAATFTKTLISPGVQFDFTGLGKAGVGDDWPINPLAGGGGSEYCDFTGYTRLSMLFKNVGTNPVDVCLFMNTGFDGNPNHAWVSETVTVGASQSAVLTLDFSSVHNIDWSGSGGGPLLNLNQVSNIGFQILGSGSGSIIVSALPAPLLYTDPTHIQKTPLPAPGDIGTTFTVSVTLENFANLAGFDIQLTWDNSLITYAGAEYTPELNTLWSGGWAKAFENIGVGVGSYELAAAALGTYATNAGASVLFKVTFTVLAKSSNVPLSTSIHFAVVKLSDNTKPVPNPILATATDGMYYMLPDTTPDITFTALKYDKSSSSYLPVILPDHFEYGNKFEVQVYVSHISANSPLEDYDLKVSYDPNLASFADVDVWGVLGTGTCTPGSGVVEVSCTNVNGWSGDSGLLFTLTFQIQFSCIPAHIWNYGRANNFLTFQVSLTDATLSFGALGSIPMSGINTTLSTLTFEVDFIRGDVNCDGAVNTQDISLVAWYYNQPASVKPEYNLNNDNVIDIFDIVVIAQNYGYGV